MNRFSSRIAVLAALTVSATLGAQAPKEPQRTTAPWTKGATCYEVFVRSFQDSDDDGMGDIAGLITRLNYINDGDASTKRDLGARCIWLMPIAESPSYHGYDVSDYYRVNHLYGTNADFKELVAEAHKRGIRVIVDMVLNHASSQHPYFKEALANPASPYRGMFRFSPTQPTSKGPWGQVAWHKSPVSNEYYYGVFWSGMPDLNYENAITRDEAKKIATFWLKEMGADGFRLDAVPYLVEEGNVLAGSPGTHRVMREWAAHVRSVNPNAYTVGEVWDSVGAMLPYYPDELDSYFAFELSDAIFAAVKTASAQKIYPGYLRLQGAVPSERYSPFLRNHDESRTMTVLGGNVAQAKMATTLLLTLPGLPFIYYGEEIGMSGDKPDERLRTPMQWAAGPGGGFTGGKAWQPFQSDSLKVTVEAQNDDPASLLNLHRRLIHLRAANSALGSGTLSPLSTGNDAVAAFLRRDDKKVVLVVANLGVATLENIALTSDSAAVRKGKFTPRDLLGAGTAAPIVVDATGRITNYVPIRSLAPMTAYIFEF